NTVFHPVDLRLRGSMTWTREDWSVSTFVNYVDDYHDPTSIYSLGGDVASWTTVDMQLLYQPEGQPSLSWLRGFSVSLSVLNLLDSDPPALNSAPLQLGYDAENASPLGRFAALRFAKKW
ncbi:MAG: hypothetical protein ACREV5_10975, partial [Steroidobacter sp.]